MPIINSIAAMHDQLTEWRRDIHAHPELGFEEHRTAKYVAEHLEAFGCDDDREVARQLIEKAGVVAIPPSVFYHRPEDGKHLIRFAFCKDEATLNQAIERLGALG